MKNTKYKLLLENGEIDEVFADGYIIKDGRINFYYNDERVTSGMNQFETGDSYLSSKVIKISKQIITNKSVIL